MTGVQTCALPIFRHLKFLGEETLLDEASILDSMVEFSEQELEVLAEFDYE